MCEEIEPIFHNMDTSTPWCAQDMDIDCEYGDPATNYKKTPVEIPLKTAFEKETEAIVVALETEKKAELRLETDTALNTKETAEHTEQDVALKTGKKSEVCVSEPATEKPVTVPICNEDREEQVVRKISARYRICLWSWFNGSRSSGQLTHLQSGQELYWADLKIPRSIEGMEDKDWLTLHNLYQNYQSFSVNYTRLQRRRAVQAVPVEREQYSKAEPAPKAGITFDCDEESEDELQTGLHLALLLLPCTKHSSLVPLLAPCP